MPKRKQLVPTSPGWWWRWYGKKIGWGLMYLNHCDLGAGAWTQRKYETFGGPVLPPKWTPKNPKCDKEKRP